jgi:hypothetical protein
MVGSSDEQARIIQETEPSAFEEMSYKKRWSSVCKDPQRGMKMDQASLTLAPWPIMNHMTPEQVQTIVTNKILKMDQNSCKHILESMLHDRQLEDKKKSMQMEDRKNMRERIRDLHQDTA